MKYMHWTEASTMVIMIVEILLYWKYSVLYSQNVFEMWNKYLLIFCRWCVFQATVKVVPPPQLNLCILCEAG